MAQHLCYETPDRLCPSTTVIDARPRAVVLAEQSGAA